MPLDLRPSPFTVIETSQGIPFEDTIKNLSSCKTLWLFEVSRLEQGSRKWQRVRGNTGFSERKGRSSHSVDERR